MGRKVFISVLGYSNYGECCYVKDGFKSSKVRFIQEATLNYLQTLEQWTENDVAYILLTNEAEQVNWYDNGHKNRDTGETIICQGLSSRLNAQHYQFPIKIIQNLPHGNSEEEIWDIFEKVFEELQDEDELYFDLTHGFRYLPMLIMVLINYSKFLKSTIVKSITYGNYESRNKENEAPIINLLPLSALQDWTYAAGQFLDSGNVQKLVELSSKSLSPILREAKGSNNEATNLKKFLNLLNSNVEDLQTCRGINIVESKNLKDLLLQANQLQSTIIKPLNPIFEKIKVQFNDFSEEPNVGNGFVAARWCVNNGLYQQAITILQENIVTYICLRQGLDYKKELERGLINKTFVIYQEEIKEEEWMFSSLQSIEEIDCQKRVIRKLLQDEQLQKLSSSFKVCTNIRNDFNHAGMRNNPAKATLLKERIKERIIKVMDIINENPVNRNKVFLNLSNHPYSEWEDCQKQAAAVYGEVIDLPFPAIDEGGDEDYIAQLSHTYLQRIKEIGTPPLLTIHLMGEMTFCFALLKLLQQEGYTCVASTSKRIVDELKPSQKQVTFQFERFRRYE